MVQDTNDRQFKEMERKMLFIQKREAVQFLVDEVVRITAELKKEFNKEKDDISDEELLRRKDDYPEISSQLERLSNKLQHVYQILPEGFNSMIISNIKSEYDSLLAEKQLYDASLQELIKERELLKEKAFQTSLLNIKLPKFKGYQSDIDIYTFQSEFEKVYLRITPKHLLPDVLKNNHLADPALSMVKTQDNMETIWERLKKAYGDRKVLLQKKLSEVMKIGTLGSIKDFEKLKEALMKLINSISDLMQLAEKHCIENKLYNGEGLNMIYGLLGDNRLTRWFNSISDEELEDKDLWTRLKEFLEKELRVVQAKSLVIPQKDPPPRDSNKRQHSYLGSCDGAGNNSDQKCHFCDEYGHVATNGPNGKFLVQYFSCEKFVKMGPHQRFKELRSKGLCHQCLFPGAKQNGGKHSNGSCQKDFICKDPSHEKYPRKKHVLVCSEHCDADQNKTLFDDYKSRFILKQKKPLPEFSKEMQLSFHIYHSSIFKNDSKSSADDDLITDNAIYELQTIEVDGQRYTIFFDSGCSDLVSKYDSIQRIGERARQEVKGPFTIGGVGDIKVESPHGVYSIRVPLHNKRNAVMAGICLDSITGPLPMYPLSTEVRNDIERSYVESGGNISNLPSLPDYVGGDVDFMIGSTYKRYYPTEIFRLPSGLCIYESPFVNADGGGRGIVGGPHPIFTKIVQSMNSNQYHLYINQQHKLFKMGVLVNPDVSMLGVKFSRDFHHDIGTTYDEHTCCLTDKKMSCQSCVNPYSTSSFICVRSQRHFEEVENAASQILYRCIDCRDCKKCKNAEQIEMMSIKEEVEQDMINKSVKHYDDLSQTRATMPLLDNPVTKLAPNKHKVLQVYYTEARRLSKEDKHDVIVAEGKLQALGFVDYARNLTPEQQIMLKENPVQNFIPWHPVWNSNSVTTSCRPVFDASMPTDSSYSLNSIVPKGKNNMNRLVEIVIRWSMHVVGMHTDVKKMYNRILLEEEYWCLQRYIWEESLDPSLIPEEKIIKTLIYGVRCSGNQAERGLRLTAEKSKDLYPDVNKIVRHDVYVDDCITGENTIDIAYQRADELSLVLKKGGFELKEFTFSGIPPDKELSPDGRSINVAGLKWFPENDELQLHISELNFAKKRRGKRCVTKDCHLVPANLTRRQCVSKVSEVFDLTGRVTPIIASFKMDLHVLIQRKLNWDDKIPDDLRPVWLSNLELLQELKHLRFKRAIVPIDAANLEINTVDTADASQQIACVAIYARFRRKNGQYSSQLVFARSKLLPEGMSQPRAELFAANLNAHTGEVVRRSFREHHKSAVKLTDSQITLHWINNAELPLKQWVRNRVVEIRRFTNPNCWKYVQSADMVADIGTRRCSSITDVSPGSIWQEGFPWMKEDVSMFPARSLSEIKLNNKEVQAVKEEIITTGQNPEGFAWPQEKLDDLAAHTSSRCVPADVALRYNFSQYIVDPNRHGFATVVRIVSYMKLFIKKFIAKYLKHSTDNSLITENQIASKLSSFLKKDINLSDADVKRGADYFYKKATLEVKHFANESQYKDISIEKDEILYYTGRILPQQEITIVTKMTDVMTDLCSTTFFVPIIDKHSPLAYSIINEVHWNSPVAKHSGIETVLRYTLKHAYIIEGRELVKKIKKKCERCRLLSKRTIDISMGPKSSYNLTIAPPFYITQTDLAGPYKAFTPHNKRTTIKIYLVIFCCSTTSTVSIKVMESYGTDSFIQAFIRLSCEVGYPKILLTDEGSQLLKGCETMRLCFHDIRNRLYVNHSVEYEVCPVGGHNMHGRVERKIKQIQESLNKTLLNERLSVIGWETVGAQVSNTVNDLPIALGSWTADLENIDLITPNRLRLGRNNERSPVGPLVVSCKPDEFIKSNTNIFNAWFESWLISCVPKLMHQPKWFKTDYDLKEGDIVLFLKGEGSFVGNYQYGMIESVETGRDGKIRTANVKYRNHNETSNRTTRRAVRKLIMIHPVSELNIMQELGEISTYTDMRYKLHHTDD